MNTTEPTTQPQTPAGAQAAAHTLRRVILTGFMGAGKSTVGQMLATRLGWTFVDLDRLIEERSRRTVAQIFAEDGETRFRRLESAALANALRRDHIVLALGGGAPETLTNRLLLEQTPGILTVFLHAPFPVLFDRCMLQSVDRPNLRDAAAAATRFETRLPLYRRLSGLVVETEAHTPEVTVERIAGSLRAGCVPAR